MVIKQINSHEWDFFLSYSGLDKHRAKKLFNILVPKFKAFLDQECIDLGDDWDKQVLNAQRRSLITVPLISENIDTAFFQREEIQIGIDLARKNPERHRVVPLFLDGISQDGENIPFGLRLKQGLDIQNIGMDMAAQRLGELALKMQHVIPFPDIIPDSTRTSPRHPLHEFPRGPMVEHHFIKTSIIKAYARKIKPSEAPLVLAEAASFRKSADPNDPTVTVVEGFELPDPRATGGTFQYFNEAFFEACNHGPRMLAALLLVVPPDLFPEPGRQDRQQLLELLRNINA